MSHESPRDINIILKNQSEQEIYALKHELENLLNENTKLKEIEAKLIEENQRIFTETQEMELETSLMKKIAEQTVVVKSELKKIKDQLEDEINSSHYKLQITEGNRDRMSRQLKNKLKSKISSMYDLQIDEANQDRTSRQLKNKLR